MIECLALRTLRRVQVFSTNIEIKQAMTKIIEAAEVSLNLHNQIDTFKLPEEIRIKHKALGQLLRSLLTTVENERIRTTGSSAAT